MHKANCVNIVIIEANIAISTEKLQDIQHNTANNNFLYPVKSVTNDPTVTITIYLSIFLYIFQSPLSAKSVFLPDLPAHLAAGTTGRGLD